MSRRCSFANVTAGLALFVALGGTATAAVTLDRDSVGSVQIARDAVRSPEIARDAVRSSEIQDGGILLRDIADGAREALRGEQGPAGPAGPAGATSLRYTKDDWEDVPHCESTLVTACPNLMSLRLTSGSWLVQATFGLSGDFGTNNHCGLVQDDFITADEAAMVGDRPSWTSEQMALSAVVTIAPDAGPQRVALRCNEHEDEWLEARWAKLTALELGSVTPQ